MLWGACVSTISLHRNRFDQVGFSLIELMVAVAVLAVVLAAAVPSFNEFRQRSALRGAADQVTSFWANARFEALKRNQAVKVGMVQSGSNFCLGAVAATSNTDTATCDCFESDSTDADFCVVARYPSSQAEWSRITAPASTGKNGAAFAVIDPKRAALGASSQAGFWEVRTPSGGPDYRLRINIDQFGRAVTCEPAAAGAKMPQYLDKRCN
jgi:prepilin-type N-terminal cleavage/methylation domain-containing protein